MCCSKRCGTNLYLVYLMNVTKTISHSLSSDFTSLSKCDCGPVLSTLAIIFANQKFEFCVQNWQLQFSHQLIEVDNKCKV